VTRSAVAALSALLWIATAPVPRRPGTAQATALPHTRRAAPPAVQAQVPSAPPSAPQPGSTIRVALVTMGPGDAVWERFGHDALWIRDAADGTDITYNYGMFDFNAPHFWSNFILGRMEYWMEGFPAESFIGWYIQNDRSVWVQELNLTPAQALALKQFLQWNALPQNRFYRYDYYRDNCTTRLRDALNRVLGGAIRQQTTDVPSGTTYRWHTRVLTAAEPLVYTGTELGLGEPVDRPISVWEEMFLPMQLMTHLRDITITGPDGKPEPLVESETTAFQARDRKALPDAPPRRWPEYLILGLALGGVMTGLGAAAGRHHRAARMLLATIAVAWALVAGVFGAVIDFLWLFTQHWAAHQNENLLQATPLSLLLVVLVPLSLLGRHRPRPAGAAHVTAWIVAGLAIAGFLLQALPTWDQVNGEIIALAMPAHIGLAVGLGLALRRPESQEAARVKRQDHNGGTRTSGREPRQ
jgi:Domain of unknown function (DUF4105)